MRFPANQVVTDSYNRYLAIAARAVRRSLKEDKRLGAERRGDMDLRFAKWSVGCTHGKSSERQQAWAAGQTLTRRLRGRTESRAM